MFHGGRFRTEEIEGLLLSDQELSLNLKNLRRGELVKAYATREPRRKYVGARCCTDVGIIAGHRSG